MRILMTKGANKLSPVSTNDVARATLDRYIIHLHPIGWSRPCDFMVMVVA